MSDHNAAREAWWDRVIARARRDNGKAWDEALRERGARLALAERAAKQLEEEGDVCPGESDATT